METSTASKTGNALGRRTTINDNARRNLASWTPRNKVLAIIKAVVITAIGAATDAIFAASVLQLLLKDPVAALISAFATMIVANAAAYFAGKILHHSPKKRWGWVLFGVWAFIGLMLGGIRSVHSQIQVPEIPDGATPGEIDRIIHTAFLADLGLGALMLAIFTATGLLLMYEAKLLNDPDLDRMLKGAKTRDRLLKAWVETDSQAIREGNLLARRNHQISYSLEQERQNAHEGAHAVREIGKEISVVTQAQLLATPTATLMTQIPRKDRPYRPAPTRDEIGEGSPQDEQ